MDNLQNNFEMNISINNINLSPPQKKPIPSLADLARKKLNNSDYNRSCWTPIGPRTEFFVNFRDITLKNLSSKSTYNIPGQIDLSILESYKNQISTIISMIKMEDISEENEEKFGIKFLTCSVFEFNETPNLVFKIINDKISIKLKNRVANAELVQKAIENRNLTHLVLPQAFYYDWGNKCQFVVEQKLLLSSFESTRQREIWNYYLREPAFKSLMEEILTDLTILICETGLHDLRADNIPFLSVNELGLLALGLVDVEYIGNARQGIEELLVMLTPEFTPIVKKVAKENLSPSVFERINFEPICKQRDLLLISDNLVEQYHIKKGILFGDEKISSDSIDLDTEEKTVCEVLVEAINNKFNGDKDVSVTERRHFSFFKNHDMFSSIANVSLNKIDIVLQKLKKNHVIFSYTKQVFFNRVEYYMVQC